MSLPFIDNLACCNLSCYPSFLFLDSEPKRAYLRQDIADYSPRCSQASSLGVCDVPLQLHQSFPMLFLNRAGLRSRLRPLSSLLLVLLPSSAVLTNWTIDDHLGDIHTGLQVHYLPATVDGGPYWKNESGCGDCAIKPPTEVHSSLHFFSSSLFKSTNHQLTVVLGCVRSYLDWNHVFSQPWTGCDRFLQLHRYASALAQRLLSFYLTGHPPKGSALYVYLILSNFPRNTSFVSDAYCDFVLDGHVVGSFNHITDESAVFQYNFLAY